MGRKSRCQGDVAQLDERFLCDFFTVNLLELVYTFEFYQELGT